MLHLTQASDPEALLGAFLAAFQRSQAQSQSLFTPTPVIVPSMSVANELKGRIASALGVSWGLDMQFWAMFEWTLIERTQRQLHNYEFAPLGQMAMHWKIFAHLQRHHDALLAEANGPLVPYLRLLDGQVAAEQGQLWAPAGARPAPPGPASRPDRGRRSHRLWHFSGELARIFNIYLATRPDWLQRWIDSDGPVPLEQLIPHWRPRSQPGWLRRHYENLARAQQRLFRELFAEDFRQREALRRDFYAQLPAHRHRLPPRLLVYLLSDAHPRQLEALNAFGALLDVEIFHHSPSPGYLCDLVDGHWRWKRSLTEDLGDQHYDSGHYLLSRLGKNHRDLGRLLQAAELEPEVVLEADENDEPTTLLTVLRRDMEELNSNADGRPERLTDFVPAVDDDSLRVFGCHGLQRQLETLRAEIVRWLNADPTRRPSDVLIVLPSVLDKLPLLRAIFPAGGAYDGYRLPARISGVVGDQMDNLWHSLTGFYRLLEGRFDLRTVSDWLLLPETHRALGLSFDETQRLLKLLRRAGFRRGFDEEHLRASLAPGDDDHRFNFCQSLDRLLRALLDDDDEEIAIPLADHRLFDALCQLALIFRRHRQQLAEGASLLVHLENLQRLLAEHYAFASGYEGYGNLQKILRDLDYSLRGPSALLSAAEQQQLPLGFIWNFVGARLAEKQTGGEPSGVITIAALRNMRLLSFKLIALVDINQDNFPRLKSDDRYNLRQLDRPRPGDRSSEGDDLAAFFDLFSHARESLWFFYSHSDPQDNEEQLPAKPLEELLFHLGRCPQLGPPAPEPSVYFRREANSPINPAATAPLWQRVQRRLQQPSAPRPPLELASAPPPGPLPVLNLRLNDFYRRLHQPLTAYLGQHQIQLPRQEEAPPTLEPLHCNGLERFQLQDFYLRTPDAPNPHLPAGAGARAWQYYLEREQKPRREHFLFNHGAQALPTLSETVVAVGDSRLRLPLPPAGESCWLDLSASEERPKHRLRRWLNHLLFNINGGQVSITAFAHGELCLRAVSDPVALLTPFFHFYRDVGERLLFLPLELCFQPLQPGTEARLVRDFFNDYQGDFRYHPEREAFRHWLEPRRAEVEAQMVALLRHYHEIFYPPFAAAQQD